MNNEKEIIETYKRVTDLEKKLTGLSDDDLLLLTAKRNSYEYDSKATSLKAVGEYQYKKFVKSKIEYLDDSKADKDDLAKYALKTQLPTKVSQLRNDAGYLTTHQSLTAYAHKSEIPTKTSDLTNDSNFLTAHQSLSDYALKSEIPEILPVPTKLSELSNDVGYLTEHQSLSNYATKEDIPTVPSKVSQLENDAGYLTEHQNLSDYAMKGDIPEVPTKVSQLNNDSGYLTEHQSLSAYALKTEIPNVPYVPTKLSEFDNDIKYITSASVPTNVSQLNNDSGYLTQHQSLSSYALKMDVPTNVSQLSNDAGYLTSHQDISYKADRDWTISSIDQAIESVIDSSPDAFNTLKKIADWILSDETGASLVIQRILNLEENKADLSGLPKNISELSNDVGYLTEHQSLSAYALKTEVPIRNSQLENDSNYITSSDIPASDPPTFELTGSAAGTNIELDINVPIVFVPIPENPPEYTFNTFESNALSNGSYTWEVILENSNLSAVSFNQANMKYVGKEEFENGKLILSEVFNKASFSVRLFKNGNSETWLINSSYVF